MLELFYWPTPNGKKVTILLEELGVPYEIKATNIGRGDQFDPEFLKFSPNNRMPALVDTEPKGGGAPIRILRSGAIMMYIAEKARKILFAGDGQEVRRHTVADVADGQSGSEVRRAGTFLSRLAERGERRSRLCRDPVSAMKCIGCTA